MSSDENECRICFELETPDDPFIYPCKCKGTSKYVHSSCLNSWRIINRENDAFHRCMECRTEYDIVNEFPLEKIKLFFCCKRAIQSYLVNYLIASTLGVFIWITEAYGNNYYFLRFMNGRYNNNSNFIYIIQNDSIAPQIFYFSFALFLQNIFFYIFFMFKIKNNVHRKTIYYKKIKNTFIGVVLFTLSFLLFFYTLKDTYPIALLNVISFFSVAEPMSVYILIKRHDKIIKWLNNNNPETLRNFQVHNPIYENNETLNNSIITSNTNNVLYESLNTDSSGSDDNENMQSLNIVIEN